MWFSVTQESTKHLYDRPLLHYTMLKLGGYRGMPARRRRAGERKVHGSGCGSPLVPAEGDVPGPVPALLHQRLVELPAGPGVDGGPAVFTVILQAGDVGAEKRGELPPAAGPLTLVTQLVIQDVWLHFHLQPKQRAGVTFSGPAPGPPPPERAIRALAAPLCARAPQVLIETKGVRLCRPARL